MLDLFENAIRCFEKWSNTNVTFHVASGLFDLTLPETCGLHVQEQCSRIASKFGFGKCNDFDSVHIPFHLYQDGCIKICRAGLLEWCIPLYFMDRRVGSLLAGVRRVTPERKIRSSLEIIREDPEPEICRFAADAPELQDAEIELVAEGLRQLAARIEKGFQLIRPRGQALEKELSPREEYMRYLIRRDCTRGLTLEKLAKNLSLSPDRTRHLVQEVTGKNYRTLLTETRLDVASQVLRHNPSVTVGVLAEHCGFTSIPGFQRAFKKRFGCSPLQYRKSSSVKGTA